MIGGGTVASQQEGPRFDPRLGQVAFLTGLFYVKMTRNKLFRWDHTNCFIGRIMLCTSSHAHVSQGPGECSTTCLSCVLVRCQIQSRLQCPSHSRRPLYKSQPILKTHIPEKKKYVDRRRGSVEENKNNFHSVKVRMSKTD